MVKKKKGVVLKVKENNDTLFIKLPKSVCDLYGIEIDYEFLLESINDRPIISPNDEEEKPP